jgi:starvation-inducible DNA-binding protein
MTKEKKMNGPSVSIDRSPGETQPRLHQHGREVQRFDQVRAMPLGLAEDVRDEVAALLNQVLSDTRILHDLYKKTHWLMRGETFYQLHLLMDKHAGEQAELVDSLAERVQTLGAVAVGDPRHVAELTSIPRPPDGAEEVPAMLSRLLEAHELVITAVRAAADRANRVGDFGSNDLLVSQVLRTNEFQAWFISEHLVDTPLVETTESVAVTREVNMSARRAESPVPTATGIRGS